MGLGEFRKNLDRVQLAQDIIAILDFETQALKKAVA